MGAGEAALSPAAYSLLADSFPPEKRATAISVYSMGIYLGSGMAFLLDGLVVAFVSAQAKCYCQCSARCVPGNGCFWCWVPLGYASMYAVKEPSREGVGARCECAAKRSGRLSHKHSQSGGLPQPRLSFLSFASCGTSAWILTFFIRNHGLTAGEVGVFYYGTLVLIASSLGIVTGGRLADILTKRGYTESNLRIGGLAASKALTESVQLPNLLVQCSHLVLKHGLTLRNSHHV